MLAGYALLLGKKHKTRINQGLVEYPRQALVRAAEICETMHSLAPRFFNANEQTHTL